MIQYKSLKRRSDPPLRPPRSNDLRFSVLTLLPHRFIIMIFFLLLLKQFSTNFLGITLHLYSPDDTIHPFLKKHTPYFSTSRYPSLLSAAS